MATLARNLTSACQGKKGMRKAVDLPLPLSYCIPLLGAEEKGAPFPSEEGALSGEELPSQKPVGWRHCFGA